MGLTFISYSHKDKIIADAVLNKLEQNNIKCWIDYRDADVGVDYAASIVKAIKACDYFILIFSACSNNSKHVLNEVNSAVNTCAKIIPFKIDDIEFNESLEYYLGKTHWLDALTPPLENHINSLINTIKKNVDVKVIKTETNQVFEKKDNNECRMVKYADLIKLGYTSSKIAMQLVENDYINCNGITEDNEGGVQQWEEFLQNNSDTFQYMINSNNQIVGDWSIVALTDETYELSITGQLLEKDIDIDKTNLICFPGVYKGYILTLSLLPEYRNMRNYNLLVSSFFKQIEEYSENEIYFECWSMNVFSKQVEALIKQLNFKYVCDNKVFGKIYTLKFIPLPNIGIIKKYKKLVENYEKFKN